jgi:LysM repeat protein
MRNLIVLFFVLISFANAQSQNLTVEGTAPNLFISHTVAPKENFYSIGRLYNQAPKAIATFNTLTMEKGLAIGQKIKIPLTNQNFDATGKAGAGENLIPLAHVVGKGENLFKIGTDHSVTAVSLRQWNNLSSDNIAVGTPLVVGHLKVKNGESNVQQVAKANTAVPAATTPVATTQPKPTPAPVVKEEAIVVAAPATTPAKEKKDDNTFTSIEVKKPVETKAPTPAPKEEPVKAEPAKPEPVKQVPVKDVSSKESPKEAPVKAQEPLQTRREEPRKEERKKIDISSTSASSAEGAFASIFSNDLSRKSLSTRSGDAASLKSTSGWQDRKYYVLMNDVAPGTVIKLSTGGSKTVYAKVLGSMPEMKENNGLLLRISNAAAAHLGILDAKFPVEISYYQ